jgi:hypothetical protein
MRTILASLVVTAVLCGGTRADVVTLTPVADNTLYFSTDGGVSNGRGSAMFAGTTASLTVTPRRALLRFDVGAHLPTSSSVVAAFLTLVESGANFDEYICTLHRMTASWGEAGSVALGGQGGGGVVLAGDATWLHRFFPATAWLNPGGDFAAASSASTSVGAGVSCTWSSPLLAADVQDMARNPAANFGWMIRGDETLPRTAKKFSTREDIDANRPRLEIRFFPTCLGDINADSFVDDADFVSFAGGYNTLLCADLLMPARCPADVNFDTVVDDADFVLFAAAYDDLLCP